MTDITSLLNEQSRDSGRYKGMELRKIDYEDIIPSAVNPFPLTEIEEITRSIADNGLMSPLTVYPDGEGKYILISGHRRYEALKVLIERDQYGTDIPCLIVREPEDIITEKENIYLANRDRPPLTEKEIKACCADLMDMWEKKTDRKGKMRDYIAAHLNISSRSLQKYINELKGPENGEKTEEDHSGDKEKSLKKLTRYVKSLTDQGKLYGMMEEAGIDLYSASVPLRGGEKISPRDLITYLEDTYRMILKVVTEKTE